MRDSRRRRLMFRDENDVDANQLQAPSGRNKAGDESKLQSQYTAGARVENQLRLVDFVPTRLSRVGGLFLLLLATVGLLNFVHQQILPFVVAQGVSAGSLELSLERGLVTWVVSGWLLATAFYCFQVFQIRKHRADDFSGRFQVWIWLAACFVLASIDSTARISPIVAHLIAATWESGFLSGGDNVWYLLVGIPVIAVCTRLVFELWCSKIAMGSMTIAGFSCGFAGLARQNVLPLESQSHSLLEANAVLVMCGFLLFTVIWYARCVLLESQGIINGKVKPDPMNVNSQSKINLKPEELEQDSEPRERTATHESGDSAVPGGEVIDFDDGKKSPALAFENHTLDSRKGKNKRKKPGQQYSRKKAA
jgi:hypothetical protein